MPGRIPTEIGWLVNANEEAVLGPRSAIDIDIPGDPARHPWDLSMLQVDLAARAVKRGECKGMSVRFKPASQPDFEPWRITRVAFERAEAMHTYTLGSTVPLSLDGAGTLRIEMDCTTNAVVRIGTIAVILPRREAYYAALYKARR